MKNFLIVSSSLMLFSCSHFNHDQKTVALPYSSELLQTIQKSTQDRVPAQLTAEALEEKSPRRVYFSSLYYQYLVLSSYLHEESAIQSCPAFHHDKVETDSRALPKVALYKASHIDPAGKNYFPELAFNRGFSLEDHQQNIRQELDILCEEGVSDNYYKFDNLVTYYADKKAFHSRPNAMASVLKIPVFANYYLVKMLEAGAGHQGDEEEMRFIRLSQTHWFGQYVVRAHEQRDQFVKNKLVTR